MKKTLDNKIKYAIIDIVNKEKEKERQRRKVITMKTNTMEFIKENFEAEELTKNLNTMIWYNEYLDLGIDGAFDFGMRGNDHNILTSCLNEDNETNLKNLHNNGWFRIVPETCTVLIAQGQELPEELEALGYDVEVYL